MIRPRATKATNSGAPPLQVVTPPKGGGPSFKARRKTKRTNYILVLVNVGAAMMVMGMIAMLFQVNSLGNGSNNNNIRKSRILLSPAQAEIHLTKVRDAFSKRYGSYSERLLQRGIQTFGSLDATAMRVLSAAQEQRPFVFAFSGYSVTVGRGNFFNQSFPFEMQRILKEPFQQIFGIDVIVRNGAIGGIPSFPYGFCLEHFLGTDPDVISWDYSMNEGGKDASVLESFLRQALQQLPKHPMLILLDRNEPRTNLLQKYATTTSINNDTPLLRDAIAVGKKEILENAVVFPEDTTKIAPGFQEWDVFGAPKQCPGRGSWHPKKQEHAMIGWMIAMHFIQALERAVQLQQDMSKTNRLLEQQNQQQDIVFPDPFSKIPQNSPEVTELLYGHTLAPKQYTMKDVSCRTSFLPATDHSKVLPSVIVSGLAEGDLDIMTDRTDQHYREGWVLDVSKVERDTKRKVERCGGLGYLDMKIALYGIPESGTLKLWLPFEGPQADHAHHDHDANTDAKHWFDDFILCEANDKRGENACHLDKDLDIVVGGVTVPSIGLVKGAGEYLKRTTCVNVGIPPTAQVTTLGQVKQQQNIENRLFGGGKDENAIGLTVDITAKAGVTRENGACCLSHIVWEQH